MFNTTDVGPRTEGNPLKALKRLARKLNVEIKFAEGERHGRYAPESKYNVSASGRKIKSVVTDKIPPMQVYTGGRPVRWRKVENPVVHGEFRTPGYTAKGYEEVEPGRAAFKPAVRIKALRPLGPKDKPQYSAPAGHGWVTVKESDIKPGESFKEQPVYERGTQRLKWKNYIRAQSELEKIPASEIWDRHRNEVQELYAGERIGPRELRTKTVQHIQNQMQRHRDYMAGEAKESLAIIRSKNASLESARAHPERMVEYKRRLEEAAGKQQAVTKAVRERTGERLSRIATRGMTQIAEEHQGDWQSKLSKLHKDLKAAASPEEEHEVQKKIHQHFLIRKSPEDIKSQARGAMGLITDKPYEYGGTPLSEVSVSSIQDILQKGSRTSKPITSGRIMRLKRRMDTMYERSVPSGIGDVKKTILKQRKIFTDPIKEIPTGYPHLGKLGVGIGAAGLLAGGALAIHAARKRRNREMRFALPPEAEGALNKIAKGIFEQAKRTGRSKSTTAIPGTWMESEKLLGKKKGVKPFSTFQIARQKWTQFIKAASGSKAQDLNPIDMKGLRALQTTHESNLKKIKTLQDQLRTKEHLGEEALKAQSEKLGAAHAVKEKESFSRGLGLGRQEGAGAAKSRYEQQAGELTSKLGQESNRRAARLKLIGAGTAAGVGIGAYALGRYDKSAHERHEARQILDLYRPKQPRQQAQPQNRPMITIGISANGSRRKNVEFAEGDDAGPEWLQEWAHKKLYGRSYSTLGQAQKVKRYAGRTHRLLRDLNIKRQGLPNIDPRGRPRKNEWEKPWVAGALTTAALIGTIKGGRGIINWAKAAKPGTRIGNLMEGFRSASYAKHAPGLGRVGGFVHETMGELNRWRDKPLKATTGHEVSHFHPTTGKPLSPAQVEKLTSEQKEKDFFHKVATGKVHKEELASRLKEVRLSNEAEALGPEAFQYAYNRPEVQKRLKKLRKAGKLPKGKYDHPDIDLMVVKYAQQYPKFQARLREIRFQVDPDKDRKVDPATLHDAAIGGIEGAASFYSTDKLLKRLSGRFPIFEKGLPRAAVSGVVGGLGTAAAGYGLNRLIRRKVAAHREKQQQMSSRLRSIKFQDPYADEMKLPKVKSQRTLVTRDRYMKQIHDRDIFRADRLYKHSAVIGAGIGALLAKKPSSLLRSAGIGAAAGVGAQKATRIYGQATRDPFGERTVRAKRVEQAPEVIGTAGLGYLALRKLQKVKLSSVLRMIQFQEKPEKHHRLLAGALVASAGIPLYRGAGKLALAARKTGNYGKQVANYIEGSRHVLNEGVTGKLAGMALRNPEHPAVKSVFEKGPSVLGELGSASGGLNKVSRGHFSSFRASPTEALQAWSEEYHGSLRPGQRAAHEARHEKVVEHMRSLWSQGYNETEALRHVSSDPQHKHFFQGLLNYKKSAIPRYAKMTGALAAVPATAGLGVAATTRKDQSRASAR